MEESAKGREIFKAMSENYDLSGLKRSGRLGLTPGVILCYDEESRGGGEARREEGMSVVAVLRRASTAGERGGLTIKRSALIIHPGLSLSRQSPGGVSIPVSRFTHLRSPSTSSNFISFPQIGSRSTSNSSLHLMHRCKP